ncbi:T9SS type A sorting domain-containing protein [bacterium]|nr:T9SS type A sorting domain-containing protein [bacterium]
MKKLLILLIIGISLTFAQTVQWTQTYHNDIDPMGWDIGWKVFDTEDGGFLIIGDTDWAELVDSVSLRFHNQFFIIKTDEFGNAITKQMYCDTVWGVKDVVKFAEDTILAFGEFGFEGYHKILGVNQEGDSIFCGVLDTIELYGVASALTNDRCLITGSYSKTGPPYWDVDSLILFKHTIEGEIVWYRRYGLPIIPNSVLQTQDSGFIIGGGTTSYNGWVMKVDSIGDTLWTVYPPCISIKSIVETAPNEFLCLGLGGYCHFFVCKIIGDGFISWSRYWMYDFADTSYAQAHSLIPTFDGNFVFCGQTGGYIDSGGESDGCLVKIDSLSNVIWQRRVDVAGRPDEFYSVIQTQDSGYVCTGYASVNSGLYEYPETLEVCLVKFSEDGDIIWENEVNIPMILALSAYPNPFNSAVSISAPDNAVVEIFDINGRCIAEFPGGDQIWKPEASVGSGVYLVRARFDKLTDRGEESVTKRVVYLK